MKYVKTFDKIGSALMGLLLIRLVKKLFDANCYINTRVEFDFFLCVKMTNLFWTIQFVGFPLAQLVKNPPAMWET